MQNNLYQSIRNRLKDKTFNIWLRLLVLTLVSASIAETDNVSLWATAFVCGIVIIKATWIIDEFMGLKHAAPLIRRIVKGYFYTMTSIVGITIGYTQITMQAV